MRFKLFLKFGIGQWVFLLLVALLLMLSIVTPISYGTLDFSFFSSFSFFLKRGVICLALLCLIMEKHGEKMALEYFMFYFVLTHAVYVIGTMLLALVPGLQDLWFSIVQKGSIFDSFSALDATRYIFRIGWQGFSGFHQTLYCTLSVLFIIYLRYGSRVSLVNTKQFLITTIFCVLGNMFYGRSGLMVTIMIGLIAVVYWNRRKVKKIIVFAASAVVLLTLGIVLLRNVPELSGWYEWMSSPIVNLITTGDMQDGSFNELKSMWNVEIAEDTFVYGDGRYSEDGSYYMHTDVGFIRNILFWGIVGFIISYGLTICSIMSLKRISGLFAVLFFIVFVIFEYKGASYYALLPVIFILGFASKIRDREYLSVTEKLEIKNEEG